MERRKHSRVPLALSLEMCAKDGKAVGRGFITNLSEGGAALETPKTFRSGDRLKLRFGFPEGSSFDLHGEIVYARDGILTRAYGARFDSVEPAIAEQLKDFLCVRV